MRLDHIAYRVKDRFKAAQLFIDAFDYSIDERVPTGFQIKFDDNTKADCLVLVPPEVIAHELPFTNLLPLGNTENIQYHMAPEIFISDGSQNSVVDKWVNARGGIGGIHHVAYQVASVAQIMKKWKENGWAQFTTEHPISCPGLTQVFTRPMEITGGIIYEFIERETFGFCKDNVRDLMESTKSIK